VFLASFLNDLDEIMIIRDRMIMLMRLNNLLDFSFELCDIFFHDWVDDLSK